MRLPFRPWFYCCKAAIPLFAIGGLGFFYPHGIPLLKTAGVAAIGILTILGVTGALLAVAVLLGGLQMICPACGLPGVPVKSGAGIGLECDACGLIRGRGFLGLHLRPERGESNDAS